MSLELEAKYICGVLELLGVRRVTISRGLSGDIVSRERLAEMLAPHLAPRPVGDAWPYPTNEPQPMLGAGPQDQTQPQ